MLFDVCSMIVRHRFIDLASLFMLSGTRGRDFLPTRCSSEGREYFQHLEGLIELIEQQSNLSNYNRIKIEHQSNSHRTLPKFFGLITVRFGSVIEQLSFDEVR